MKNFFSKINILFNKFLQLLLALSIMKNVSELIQRGNHIKGNNGTIQLFDNKTSTVAEIDVLISKVYDYAINGCVMAEVTDLQKNVYVVPLASIIMKFETKRNLQTKQETYASKKGVKTFNLISVEYFNNTNALTGYKALITDHLSPMRLDDYAKISDKIYPSHDEALSEGWKVFEKYLNATNK